MPPGPPRRRRGRPSAPGRPAAGPEPAAAGRGERPSGRREDRTGRREDRTGHREDRSGRREDRTGRREGPAGHLEVPADRLEALLGDLGPSLRRGTALRVARAEGARGRVRASGLPEVDAAIGGGFPADRLSEITGPVSSGRTSVMLALLARTTGTAGELAAVVDLTDAFDPVSAEAAGVDLDRVLWVRAGGHREALRAAERLIGTEGIPLVVLDAGAAAEPPDSAWIRLARAAPASRTTLVVVSDRRLTGSQAELVVEMRPARPRFAGTPPLFEAIGLHAVPVRRRGRPVSEEVAAGHPTDPTHPVHPAVRFLESG